MKTEFVEIDGKWEEVLVSQISGEEHDKLRKTFSQYVFDSSLNFESNGFETISFSWRF